MRITGVNAIDSGKCLDKIAFRISKATTDQEIKFDLKNIDINKKIILDLGPLVVRIFSNNALALTHNLANNAKIDISQIVIDNGLIKNGLIELQNGQINLENCDIGENAEKFIAFVNGIADKTNNIDVVITSEQFKLIDSHKVNEDILEKIVFKLFGFGASIKFNHIDLSKKLNVSPLKTATKTLGIQSDSIQLSTVKISTDKCNLVDCLFIGDSGVKFISNVLTLKDSEVPEETEMFNMRGEFIEKYIKNCGVIKDNVLTYNFHSESEKFLSVDNIVTDIVSRGDVSIHTVIVNDIQCKKNKSIISVDIMGAVFAKLSNIQRVAVASDGISYISASKTISKIYFRVNDKILNVDVCKNNIALEDLLKSMSMFSFDKFCIKVSQKQLESLCLVNLNKELLDRFVFDIDGAISIDGGVTYSLELNLDLANLHLSECLKSLKILNSYDKSCKLTVNICGGFYSFELESNKNCDVIGDIFGCKDDVIKGDQDQMMGLGCMISESYDKIHEDALAGLFNKYFSYCRGDKDGVLTYNLNGKSVDTMINNKKFPLYVVVNHITRGKQCKLRVNTDFIENLYFEQVDLGVLSKIDFVIVGGSNVINLKISETVADAINMRNESMYDDIDLVAIGDDGKMTSQCKISKNTTINIVEKLRKSVKNPVPGDLGGKGSAGAAGNPLAGGSGNSGDNPGTGSGSNPGGTGNSGSGNPSGGVGSDGGAGNPGGKGSNGGAGNPGGSGSNPGGKGSAGAGGNPGSGNSGGSPGAGSGSNPGGKGGEDSVVDKPITELEFVVSGKDMKCDVRNIAIGVDGFDLFDVIKNRTESEFYVAISAEKFEVINFNNVNVDLLKKLNFLVKDKNDKSLDLCLKFDNLNLNVSLFVHAKSVKIVDSKDSQLDHVNRNNWIDVNAWILYKMVGNIKESDKDNPENKTLVELRNKLVENILNDCKGILGSPADYDVLSYITCSDIVRHMSKANNAKNVIVACNRWFIENSNFKSVDADILSKMKFDIYGDNNIRIQLINLNFDVPLNVRFNEKTEVIYLDATGVPVVLPKTVKHEISANTDVNIIEFLKNLENPGFIDAYKTSKSFDPFVMLDLVPNPPIPPVKQGKWTTGDYVKLAVVIVVLSSVSVYFVWPTIIDDFVWPMISDELSSGIDSQGTDDSNKLKLDTEFQVTDGDNGVTGGDVPESAGPLNDAIIESDDEV